MNGISTHVLDTANGKPAAGVPVRLFSENRELASEVTNQDGRCPKLLPDNMKLEAGIYRIVFEISAKFPNSFYPTVEISFRVTDPSTHHHIPLLLSPFGFTTYRGS